MIQVTDVERSKAQMVRKFQTAMDLRNGFFLLFDQDQPEYDLWTDLIAEEMDEVIVAGSELEDHGATPERIDALVKELADLLYVIYGFANTFGISLDAAFERVHESNMSKLDDNGKPIYREDGKVLKGPNYKPPNMRGCWN